MIPDSRFLDTIVAPATPSGRSALAVVRLSGSGTLRVLAALAPRFPAPPEARRSYLVALVEQDGEPIDTGLVTFFAGPASATGEDVGEISVHGSPAVVARLILAATRAGARLARPGEFTERAFRLGKIDLLRAEAVKDLIDARTPAAAGASARRLAGGLSDSVERVRQDLLAASAGLAAAIDFTEDAGEAVDPAVETALEAAVEALTRLAKSYETGRLLADGCRVAILGQPNAGKSTLFNALAGEKRAIVTEIPGTTRDALEASIDLHGIPVTLVDTAGLRQTGEIVERIGVERAWEEAERSDAILYVFDASQGWREEDRRAIAELDGRAAKPRMWIANKVDRARGKFRRSHRERCGSAGSLRMRESGWPRFSTRRWPPRSRRKAPRRCSGPFGSATSSMTPGAPPRRPFRRCAMGSRPNTPRRTATRRSTRWRT